MPALFDLSSTTPAGLRVLVAPDSFKGTLTATDAAAAIAEGWARERPRDTVTALPLADGGEGTVAALAAAVRRQRAESRATVHVAQVHDLYGSPLDVPWLELPRRRAVVDLASCCGLPQLRVPDPLGCDTTPLGELLLALCRFGVRHISIGLGGSASTDAGTGALRALGARLLDASGRPLPRGGGALARLASIDTSRLRRPPRDGVDLLVDVTNPLCGPRGAATVFGPQKGASPRDIAALEGAMERVRDLVGAPEEPGSGAAGGAAYGLASLWGARIVPGAERILDIARFDEALAGADLVITGEGRFDSQSLGGKLVGAVAARARRAGIPLVVLAGAVEHQAAGSLEAVSLSDLAGSSTAACAEPGRWLARAARDLARRHGGTIAT